MRLGRAGADVSPCRWLAVGLLGLMMAGCGPAFIRPGPAVTAPRLEPSSLIARDGATLVVERWPATSPARGIVVALHSFGDYARAFETLGPGLAAAGYGVVAIDQRGFGRNADPGRWPGTDALVDDAVDLVTALRAEHPPGTPVWLLGESMGGAVAMVAAARAELPELKGLLLAAPAVREGIPNRYGWNVVLATLAVATPWYQVAVEHDDERLVATARARLGAAPPVQRSVRLDTYYGLIRLADAASDAAPHIALPTLLLYGTADVTVKPVSICALVREMPGPAASRIYPGGVHRLLHQTAFELELSRTLEAFLDGRPLPTGSGIDAAAWCAAPATTSADAGRASR